MRTLLGQSVQNITTNADFPKGTPKDDSPLGSKTGTPLTEKAGIADCYNALLAVIAEAGLTPNEQAEKQVGGSQFLDALEQLFSKNKTAEFFYVWTLDGQIATNTFTGFATYTSGLCSLLFCSTSVFIAPPTGVKRVGIAFCDEQGDDLLDMGDMPLFMQRSNTLSGITCSSIFVAQNAGATLAVFCGYNDTIFQAYTYDSLGQQVYPYDVVPYDVVPNGHYGCYNPFSVTYKSALE